MKRDKDVAGGPVGPSRLSRRCRRRRGHSAGVLVPVGQPCGRDVDGRGSGDGDVWPPLDTNDGENGVPAADDVSQGEVTVLLDPLFAADEDKRGSHAIHLFGPVEDFGECRFHVNTEKMQDSMFPAGNGVAGGMADLHHCAIGKFSCNRDGLFDEAEENLLHKASSSASTPSFLRSIATPSIDSIKPYDPIKDENLIAS